MMPEGDVPDTVTPFRSPTLLTTTAPHTSHVPAGWSAIVSSMMADPSG
jgi:hypothetical protein